MTETPRAAQAWADYLALGPDRSLAKLLAHYHHQRQSDGKTTVPTTQLRRLEQWSSQHDWQGRLKAIADAVAAEAEQRDYIRAILESRMSRASARARISRR